MPSLDPNSFPSSRGLIKANWAPIVLRPIMGSPELFVIGVAAADSLTVHLEQANKLERLRCLYESNADLVVLAVRTGLDALHQDISARGPLALRDFQPVLSGVGLGEMREGEGQSLAHIAQSWLASVSSLYSPVSSLQANANTNIVQIDTGRARDRLPDLVLNYVAKQRPGLADFFSHEIRQRARRRQSANASALYIDYAGSKVVANFGTLAANNYSASVDRLKRRLWDLVIARDAEKQSFPHRSHEMLVQRPPDNDPQFTERQSDKIKEGVEMLRDQAKQEDVEFYALTTVPEIGDHLVLREAA